MNALLEMAIEQVRALPPERQEEIAQVLLDMAAADEEDVYVLTPEEMASLAASIEQAKRGEFASDEEVEAIWRKYGA